VGESRPVCGGEALSRHAVNPAPFALPALRDTSHIHVERPRGSTRGVPPLTVLKGLPLHKPQCRIPGLRAISLNDILAQRRKGIPLQDRHPPGRRV